MFCFLHIDYRKSIFEMTTWLTVSKDFYSPIFLLLFPQCGITDDLLPST